MKKNNNKNKQLVLQQNAQQYEAYPKDQQHNTEGNVGQHRQSFQKPGHKTKVSGLNQSMDAGINNYAQTFSGSDGGQKLYVHSQDSYHQNNYVSNTFDKSTAQDTTGQSSKPTHFRSGSHAVGGGGQQALKGSKQYSSEMQALIHQQQVLLKMSGSGQGELSQAQLAQMASLQQNNGFVVTRDSDRDRTQQQKVKHKHNMSQNIQMIPHNDLGKNGGVVQKLQHSFIAPHEVQQNSSKRGYEGGYDKQGNRSAKQKYQAQQAQYSDSQQQFESARYNSIGALHATTQISGDPGAQALHQNVQDESERLQGTQKVGKKGSKISGGQGGSIILSAGPGIQGVPQLKAQFNKGHHTQTHQNKSSQQIPMSNAMNSSHGGAQHQRMNSDTHQLGPNMRSGFNSASNAAIQQQAQIVQIYQQQHQTNMAGNSTASMAKMKYHTNNSRKVIPMLQQNQPNQVVSHHKRTTQHMQQQSRDRDGKALMESSQGKFVDSYPQGNYQTYSLNYNSGPSQLQGVSVRKSQVADTSRANRVASREQAQRRAMMGGDMNSVKVIHGELNSSYNQMTGGPSGLAIPQKKQKSLQSQQLKAAHGHNASFNNASNHSSFNQTTTQGFFNDGSTNQTNGPDTRSGKVSGVGSNTIKHGKSGSQYTPQLAQSLKHTINNTAPNEGNQNASMQHIENVQLQTKKSGPIQQTHMRQTSVQVAVDAGNQSKKLSIQHRKNKSVLNNQIRINPSLQNPSQGIKMRVNQDNMGGKQKINQYFDNYTDAVPQSFYSQQVQHQQSNLSVAHQAQQLMKGPNKNLSNATLKHNLAQSSHRKNKTSVIGGGATKMLGINSSSVFQAPQSLIASENAHAATMKKIVGGTISHSHKSLRSQSSNRKRVASMDSSGGLEKADQASKYQMPMSHSSKKQSGVHSGQLTPDLSSYNNANGSKHQQKVQKFLSNQTGGQLRQQLKPQGNIVIQQQQSQHPGSMGSASSGGAAMTQHQANLKSSQGNRRHASLLKGEHQDKSLVYIGQDHQVTSAQAQIARFGKHHQQDGARYQDQSPDLGDDSSSMRGANNLVFVDGGTGGGSQKPNARQLSGNRDHSQQDQQIHHSQYKTDKKHQIADNDDYNLQRELQNRDRSSAAQQKQQIQKQSSKILHKSKNRFDGMDAQGINMPDDVEVNLGHGLSGGANRAKDSGNRRPGSSHPRGQIGARDKAEKARMHEVPGEELDYSQSINITTEALERGKVPPERVAQMIADSGHTLTKTDAALSPRTREIVGISNQIRKSFLQKGDAPKTTPEFYRAGKMLGRGAFGKVSLGMHKLSRKLVALKSINKEFMTDEKSKSKVMHEVGILLRLRHKSVVKLYETFETKRHMLLAMELCAGGDLLNYVRKRKKLDEGVSKVIFRQIIDGLGYIHKKRILHRDIKLDNILLDGKGNVKIADFGVSKLVKPGDIMHEQSGTPAYIAPEILKEEGYAGFKADIWSAGVVLYAMLCGTVPFKASNMKELHKMIIKGKYHLKEEVSDEAKSLMKAMLNTDPNSRISIAKILEHPWMQLPEERIEIFNQEERDVVKKEFIYNNPAQPNRSEAINEQVEPWDCFTELNLDSINEVLRNESEKSVILAPFNSSLSDFNEDEWAGMDAGLIIHRLFDDAAPLEDKKDMVRFAARCRDQDRQYEINNNGELDNGVYHKFVYSSRDGQPEASSSVDAGGSIEGLRPMSSRNLNKKGSDDNIFKKELEKQKKAGRRFDSEMTAGDDEHGLEDSYESAVGLPGAIAGGAPPNLGMMDALMNFGYPEDYLRFCLVEGEASYCMAAYYLLCEDQQY